MVVQHNMSALNANRMLGSVNTAQAKSTEKLSSGYKINRAGDNAAGLAISEKMRGQIRGLNQASANAQDGISLIQTAEGALTETHSILQRMRELAVQASSDTNTDDDRTQIQNEIDQLTSEVDRIANTTEFNTKKLLDGSQTGSVSAKDGTAKVEGDFGNSTVAANITTNNATKTKFTDVIRIEVKKDFEVGTSTKGTTKLTDKEIDNYNKLLTVTDGFALEKFAVGQGDNDIITVAGTPISATNYSFDENLKVAVSAVKTKLSEEVTLYNTSTAAIEGNNEKVNALVTEIMKKADAISKKTTNGENFFKDGVTEDDLKEALNELINGYVENGKLAATSAASGESDSLKVLEDKLKNLFTDNELEVTGTGLSAADSLTFTAVGKDNTSKFTAVGNVADTTDKLSKIGENVGKLLIAVSKNIAGVKISNDIQKGTMEQLQNIENKLADKELMKAIVEYKKEDKTYQDLNKAGSTASDERKAEQKLKVDEAKAKLDALNKDEEVLSVTDLFGNGTDSKSFEIAKDLDKDNNLILTMKNGKDDSTVITIKNADKLKAGDTITISSEKAVESKPAKAGDEALRLQIGANAGQELSLGINSMKATDLNIVQTKEGSEGKALSVSNQASASLAVNIYDMALQRVSTERAKMGAIQNRLEHTIANLDTSSENLQTAESRIRDTDMAAEMVNFSKNNIIQQAAQSMLAQANQANQGVLSLLR